MAKTSPTPQPAPETVQEAVQEADFAVPAPQYISVPIDSVHPNAYNPNHMEAELFELLNDHVKTEGLVQPPLVRPHPEIPGHYVIVDGEHRWRTAKTIGMKTITVCVSNYDEATAMLRTLSMNAIKGQNIPIKLANMLSALQHEKGFSPEAIARMTGLPLDEMNVALRLLEIPDFETESPDMGSGIGADLVQPSQITLMLMPHEKGSYEAAMQRAMALADPSVLALIGLDVSTYKQAMGQAMGLSGVKLRNVSLAIICEAFLGMTEDQKKAAITRLNEKAEQRFHEDIFPET